MCGWEVVSLNIGIRYLIEAGVVCIKVDLNGGPESILGDFFNLSDLPLVLIVCIQVVPWLELAVEIISL
jgi:hypothetical protein